MLPPLPPHPELDSIFSSFKKEAFRLKLLPVYKIPGEWEIFQDWKLGKPTPSLDEKLKEFGKTLKGKKQIRLHVIPEKLTDYLRFEITNYSLLAKLTPTDVYLLNEAEYKQTLSKFLGPKLVDYWMFDDDKVIEMHYNQDYTFKQERLVKDEKKKKLYRLLKKALIETATPLSDWLKARTV